MNSLLSLFTGKKKTSKRDSGTKRPDSRGSPLPDPINDKVVWVAEAFQGDLSEFRSRAAAAAIDLGPLSVGRLPDLFHSENTPPADLAARFPGLGGWMTARQFAIFEIFYNLGEVAMPAVERIAFGNYDWTQGNAIEVLCRFAAEGLDRERIVTALVQALPDVRHEAHYYALGPLLQQCESNPALVDVIARLRVVSEFEQSYQDVVARTSSREQPPSGD